MDQGKNSDLIGALQSIAQALTGTPLVQSNPCKFHATMPAGGGLGVGWNLLNYPNEDFDSGSNYSAGVFTAPNDGYYLFFAGYEVTINSGEDYIISLYKNGAEYRRGLRARQGGAGAQAATYILAPPPIFLLSGNTVQVAGYNGSGGAKSISANAITNYFGGGLFSLT